MSALRELELALRAVRTSRAHLRAARERARAVRLDGAVLLRLQCLADEEAMLVQLAAVVAASEEQRRATTRAQGRRAA